MKILFLIFHGFNLANGISKKIHYQVKALCDNGFETHLCWMNEEYGDKRRMIDNMILKNHGNGIKGKILKRTDLSCIKDYMIDNQITHLYIRSDHNASPFLISFLKKVKTQNIKIALEIPTYPYDQEYDKLGVKIGRAHV